MLKTLLYIDENLASSIALRFTGYLNKFIPLSLFVIHVEQAGEQEQAGEPLQKTWEEGAGARGRRTVYRMLRTENIDCPLAGRPKIFIGNRIEEITYELRSGSYQFYIEGYLNTAEPDRFYRRISSPLYTQAPCPVLLVKNLSISKKCALLCADGVDPEQLVRQSMKILGNSGFRFDLICFRYKEKGQLEIRPAGEDDATLREVHSRLLAAGKSAVKSVTAAGTPEQVGNYLKDYALVASTLPASKSRRMATLASSQASVLLVH
ncbi:MAG TPA: hypothetical protein ENK27_08170 [Desulfobulbus sp.]|nr:hypothetical protein [Desulfobulbus sp.]